MIECSKNYRKTTGSLWNYYEDKPGDPITNSEPFEYKSNITEKHQIMTMMIITQKMSILLYH